MKRAAEFICEYDSFIIATHLNPEGDAIGASIGAAKILSGMGKRASVHAGDPVPSNLLFLPGSGEVVRDVKELPDARALIVLDCGDLDRPGEDFKSVVSGRPLLNIDHHGTNTYFGDVNWVDPEASSAGEMIAELAAHMGAEVSEDAALCLYTAILTDTGSFQFNNTTPRALRAAARMIEAGARPDMASENYYHSKEPAHLLLMSLALQTLEFHGKGTLGEMVVTTEMFQNTGTGPEAVEGLINVITDAKDVKVAVLYRQTGAEEWKVSMRSKGEVDVAGVAKGFGGGGHKNAAGFRISAGLEKVKALVREKVEEQVIRHFDADKK